MTFDGESEAQVHAEALTREIQQSFKRLDAAIRAMAQSTGRNEDAEVRLQVQRQLASVSMPGASVGACVGLWVWVWVRVPAR